MKKIIALTITILFITNISSGVYAFAEDIINTDSTQNIEDMDVDYSDFEIDIVDDHAVVAVYTGDDTVVKVPSEYEGYKVTSIEPWAFEDRYTDSSKIETVILPDYYQYDYDYDIKMSALTCFKELENLKQILVTKNNQNFTSIDGVLYSKDKKVLCRMPCGIEGEYNVLDGVTGIFEYAFENSKLSVLNLPNTLIDFSGEYLNSNISYNAQNIINNFSISEESAKVGDEVTISADIEHYKMRPTSHLTIEIVSDEGYEFKQTKNVDFGKYSVIWIPVEVGNYSIYLYSDDTQYRALCKKVVVKDISKVDKDTEDMPCKINGTALDYKKYSYDDEKLEEVDKVCDMIINKYIKESYTDLEKKLAVINYILSNCEYGQGSGEDCFTAYGALVDHEAVCAGYVEACNILLNKVGIESHIVASNELDHAWNVVKIDGKYYQLDVTWMEDFPYEYRYFNFSNEQDEHNVDDVKDNEYVKLCVNKDYDDYVLKRHYDSINATCLGFNYYIGKLIYADAIGMYAGDANLRSFEKLSDKNNIAGNGIMISHYYWYVASSELASSILDVPKEDGYNYIIMVDLCSGEVYKYQKVYKDIHYEVYTDKNMLMPDLYDFMISDYSINIYDDNGQKVTLECPFYDSLPEYTESIKEDLENNHKNDNSDEDNSSNDDKDDTENGDISDDDSNIDDDSNVISLEISECSKEITNVSDEKVTMINIGSNRYDFIIKNKDNNIIDFGKDCYDDIILSPGETIKITTDYSGVYLHIKDESKLKISDSHNVAILSNEFLQSMCYKIANNMESDKTMYFDKYDGNIEILIYDENNNLISSSNQNSDSLTLQKGQCAYVFKRDPGAAIGYYPFDQDNAFTVSQVDYIDHDNGGNNNEDTVAEDTPQNKDESSNEDKPVDKDEHQNGDEPVEKPSDKDEPIKGQEPVKDEETTNKDQNGDKGNSSGDNVLQTGENNFILLFGLAVMLSCVSIKKLKNNNLN